jgi:peptidoglycan/LPS O-acetylase OafA/YrhL
MNHLTLTTPALLFSAISLVLLAYTNRFLSYANVVRQLHDTYVSNPDEMLRGQISNLRKRLYLIRSMQVLGVSSLLLCVLCMFLIYVGWIGTAEIVFGAALLLLIASLGASIHEIQISVKALELHLSDMQ